jgi:ubiquinone/menaquinone biosynthesis C-methylase UbiE
MAVAARPPMITLRFWSPFAVSASHEMPNTPARSPSPRAGDGVKSLARAPRRFRGVATTSVQGSADVRSFFDRIAAVYAEQHGDADRLLARRLALIRTHARLGRDDVVLDVGCGPGHHLEALAPEIARGVGVDLSPRMIEVARARLCGRPLAGRIAFDVGDAATLAGVATGSVDLAICIGALEHVLDKRAALASVHRVLRRGGRLFCLGPSGDYLWYRAIAPALGLATKHLSTDVFLTRRQFAALLAEARFDRVHFGSWTFIPRGDLPALAALALEAVDVVGRAARLSSLRGGLWMCAWKDEKPAPIRRG